MNFKRTLSLTLALVLLFALAAVPAAAAEDGAKKATVMIYLCGSNLESDNLQGTKTISDILSTRYDMDDINVVVLLGGSKAWGSGYSTKELTLLEVGGRRPRMIEAWELASMGDPSTLLHFLEYCHENYPAESYDLVVWDHGGGPVYGVCQDSLFPPDMLETGELVDALSASPFRDKGLDLIVFAACLMGSAEVAVRVAPFARYMIGSEDSMYGLSYDWLAGMENDAAPLDTARRLVDTSYERNEDIIKRQNATQISAFSVVDLSRIGPVLTAMDDFFDGVNADLNEISFTSMSNLRRETVSFGIGSSGDNHCFDLIDLGDITGKYSDMDADGAAALETALEDAVVYCRSSRDDCTGLTVYHPFLNKDEMKARFSVYNDLGFSAGYTGYIQRFASILTQTPLADWADLRTDTPAADKDKRTLFTLALSDEQSSHFGQAALAVLLRQEDGSYSFTYLTPGTQMDETGRLTGEFNGTALYAVDSEGRPLSFELEYAVRDDGYWLIPAQLIRFGEEGAEDVVHSARITCTLESASRTLIPGSVSVRDNSGGYTSAFGTVLDDYDEIVLTGRSRRETYDEQGALLAFDRWDVTDERELRLALDGSWEFRLLNDTLDTARLFASFQVTDSQNNVYSSEPRVIRADRSEAAETRVSYDDAGLVLLESFRLDRGEDALLLSADLTNLSDTEAHIVLDHFRLNGESTDVSAEVYGTGKNWGLLPGETQLLFLAIPADAFSEDTVLTAIDFDLTLVDSAQGQTIGTVPVEVSLQLSLGGEG